MAFTLTLAEGDRASLYPSSLYPALCWQNAPARTQSFVLLCHDPEAEGGDRAYWLRFDLPAVLTALPKGDAPAPGQIFRAAPAAPPRVLYFELYALDIPVLCLPAADWDAVDAAMEGHLLSRARLCVPLSTDSERTPSYDDRQPR